MKLYYVGPTVDMYDAKTGFLFPTVTITGEKQYSNAYLIETLLVENKQLSHIAFTNLEDARKYISTTWKAGCEPSSYEINNLSNYDGPEFTPIIYEIEVLEEISQEFPKLNFVPCQREESADGTIRSTNGEDRFLTDESFQVAKESKYNPLPDNLLTGDPMSCYKLDLPIIASSTLASATLHNTVYPVACCLQSYKRFTLNEFITAYQRQYSSEFLKNPLSSMHQLIKKNNLYSMAQVYQYAFDHPKSRTARVLNVLIKEPELLSNSAYNNNQPRRQNSI